jgi:hypothetical protein
MNNPFKQIPYFPILKRILINLLRRPVFLWCKTMDPSCSLQLKKALQWHTLSPPDIIQDQMGILGKIYLTFLNPKLQPMQPHLDAPTSLKFPAKYNAKSLFM